MGIIPDTAHSEDLEDEIIRLRNDLRYYQNAMCLMPPKKYYAVKDGDAVAEIDTQRVSDILKENEKLKKIVQDKQILVNAYKEISEEFKLLFEEERVQRKVLSDVLSEFITEIAMHRVKNGEIKNET